LTGFQTETSIQTLSFEHAISIEWLAESLKGLKGTGE